MEEFATATREEADELILENKAWAEQVARAVGRAWKLDWQQEGLDGAALEALIFCARRFQPDRGVPFRGYSRRRIHEAATEAARRSKGWKKGGNSEYRAERLAREISAELFNIFPELRSGELPVFDGDSNDRSGDRIAIQQLLVGASVIAARQGLEDATPDEIIEYKRTVTAIAKTDPVHQNIMWHVYWEGKSLRQVATDLDVDELNVIREHKVLLEFLQKEITTRKDIQPPRVRPGLRELSFRMRKKDPLGMVKRMIEKESQDG